MVHFYRFLLIFVHLLFSTSIYAQSLSNLGFGNDNTFDVITWNLESFPKLNGTTENYVSDIIIELESEIIGFQEINDISAFNTMMAYTSGYSGYVLDANYGGINMAYAVKNDVSVIDEYAILSSSTYNYAFAGRPPYLIHLEKNNIEYYVINVHLKCCGDGNLNTSDSSDEENRRLVALNHIKSYIDNNLSNENVLVIGDYNDELDDVTDDNVFQNFIDDSDNYLFADMSIANGNPQNFSFPNWPSHIDHILITNELFDEFNSNESDITTIQVDNYISGGFSSYDALITDHMPVGISLVYTNGCTDPLALNYNPDAVSDDGSCTYDTGNENTVLFISEYAEGSSNNKYLEIYNPTTSAVSLENYAMAIVVNAPAQVGVYDSWHYFDIGSTVPANGVFIVAHPSADAFILSLADMTTTHLSNGDDGIALVYGNQPSTNSSPAAGGYTVVDRIGDWNGDPGSGWSVAGVSNATKDHTLVRKCSISQGNADWTASSGSSTENSEWQILPNNDWSDLGQHYYPCEIIIQGCTDHNSINYNEEATVDDGSCICCYFGCTDEIATNYNPNAYFNDGSCEYISGCTDALASNYNTDATLDDGSCIIEDNPCDYVPSGLYVNNIIHNRVQFNWIQPQELPSYYMIRYRPSGSSSWTVMTAGTQNINPYAGTSRIRYFLQANTNYDWSIRARVIDDEGNVVCQSPWSQTANFNTLPNCPNLENLSVVTEANWVTLTADSPNGDFDIWQSKGKIREVGTSDYRYVNGSNSINVLKGNFEANTNYEWHTKAWCTGNVDELGNSDPQYHSGWGDFSTFNTQLECDKTPYNLLTTSNASNTTITMSWDPPTNGYPDHYFLELNNLTTGQTWAWNDISAYSNSKTKFGLTIGNYSWRIRGACGSNGTSWATPFTAYEYYTLGTNRIANQNYAFNIYPNPSQKVFNVNLRLPTIEDVKIKITNSIGQIVFQDLQLQTNSYKQRIDLSFLPNATYIISATTISLSVHKTMFLH